MHLPYLSMFHYDLKKLIHGQKRKLSQRRTQKLTCQEITSISTGFYHIRNHSYTSMCDLISAYISPTHHTPCLELVGCFPGEKDQWWVYLCKGPIRKRDINHSRHQGRGQSPQVGHLSTGRSMFNFRFLTLTASRKLYREVFLVWLDIVTQLRRMSSQCIILWLGNPTIDGCI